MAAQAASSALPLGLPALGPHLRGALDLSLPALGALLAAPTAGFALTMFAWGALSDRLGERRVLVAGLTLSAALLVAAATVAGSALGVGLLLVAAGAAGACAPAASGRAVVAWFPPHERGLALSLRHTAPMAGGALGAAVLPIAAGAAGTGGALVALAVISLLGAVGAAGVIAEDPAAGHPEAAAGHAEAAAAPAVRHPATDGRVWMLAAAGGLVVVAQAALLRFQSAYLHDDRGWSESAAASVLSVTLLSAAALRVLAGVWSDRRGRRVGVLRDQALAAAVLLAAVGFLAGMPAALAAGLLVAATALTMAGNGVAYAAVSDAAPLRTGAALGLYSTVLIVLVTAAPPAFGLLADAVPLGRAFGLLAVFPLAGALVLTALARRLRRARTLH